MKRLTEHRNVLIDDCCYDIADILGLYRLQVELLWYEGIVASLEECIDIWQGYSSDLCASWLDIKGKELIKQIKSNDYFVSFDDYIKKLD